MIPVRQTILRADDRDGTRRGNCLQAAVASVFELPLDEVPHFVAEDDWWDALEAWLAERNIALVCLLADEFENGCVRMGLAGFYLVVGKSPRGDFSHVVVYSALELVHDPHPDGSGLDGPPTGVYYFVAADPSKQPVRVAS